MCTTTKSDSWVIDNAMWIAFGGLDVGTDILVAIDCDCCSPTLLSSEVDQEFF